MAQKGLNNGGKKLDVGDPMTLGFIIIGTYFIFMILWMVLHTQIAMGYAYLRYALSYPAYLLSSFFKDVPILSYPYDYIQKYCSPEPGLLGLCRQDFSKFTWQDLCDMSLSWNVFFGAIFIAILTKAYIRTNGKHPQASFAKEHTLSSFINEQQKLYPHLRIYTKIDLIDEPINHPMYGMSLTSRQFAGIYALAQENESNNWEILPDGSFLPILDQERLRHILVEQLGSTWLGWRKLSDTELIIFAALLPLVAATDPQMNEADFIQAKTESIEMRKKAWALFDGGQVVSEEEQSLGLVEDELASLWLLYPKIKREDYYPVIEKYRGSKVVQEAMAKHGFVRTIIYELVKQARTLGVLEPADFRWLHYCDRSLWYVIQSVDRNRPFAEAAATHDHYNFEVLSNMAIYYPFIKNAIAAINEEVSSFKYTSRNLLREDYSIWLTWRPESIKKLFPGIDMIKTIENFKKINI